MATILTNAGRAKLLVATPMAPVTLSHIAFGNGGGSLPTPNGTETALVGELIRVDCTNPVRDTTDPTVIAVTGTIPRTFAGGVLREVGLFDNVGVLIAYGSVATVTIPAPTTEYGLSYTGTIRVKLDNTTMVTVINSDAPAFDHRGLTYRNEPDAHPASSITLSQTGRTVQSWVDIRKVLTASANLLTGEDNLLNSNNTFTLPSTSGLAAGSKVSCVVGANFSPVVQVQNTGTEQIRFGNSPIDEADYDSVLCNIGRFYTFTWTGTTWRLSI